MRKILFSAIIIIVFSNQNLFSQSKYTAYTKNCVYFELCGQGTLYSINYEDRITTNFSYRIGFSKFWLLADILAIPAMINYISGKGNHHLEIGLGIVGVKIKDHIFCIEDNSDILGTATIGYRYQPSSAGLMFKIGFTPFFDLEIKDFSPFGGISLGYVF